VSIDDRRNHPEFLGGYFLISEVELMDPNFFRTVVLLVSHDDEGAFGLVVNRKSDVALKDLVEGVEDTVAGDLPIFIGGPVQQEYLFVVHSGLPEAVSSGHESKAAEGVIFEPATERLIGYLNDEWSVLPDDDRPRIHLYAGYSGWGGGQLERELGEEAWLVLKASGDIVFHQNPEQGWKDALSRKGPFYRIVAETGFKPSMN
jgi:putative transcriptional regulator